MDVVEGEAADGVNEVRIASLPLELTAKKRRKAKKHGKSDDRDSNDDIDNIAPRHRHSKLKDCSTNASNMPHINLCKNCYRRFTPESNRYASEFCEACESVVASRSKQNTNITDRMTGASKLKRKRMQMKAFEMTGQSVALLSLRDMCIRLVAEMIDAVEKLGPMPHATKRQISRIISKRRQLNNETVQLFVGADEQIVELFDCTAIDADGLSSIAMLCPNVTTMNLSMCGQMTDDALQLLGEHCTVLSDLTLTGCFLVSDSGFSGLFSGLGDKLTRFRLEYASNLSDAGLMALSEQCPSLASLHLNVCTRVSDEGLLHLNHFKQLQFLHLSGLGDNVTVDALTALITQHGCNLKTLALDDFQQMNDDVFHLIAVACENLELLSLESCTGITPEGAIKAMNVLKAVYPRKGLAHLSLNRNILFTDDVIIATINQVGHQLQTLSINGLDELTEAAISAIANGCPLLTTLDVSWIRCVTDALLECLFENSTYLKVVRVHGCHHLSSFSLNKFRKTRNDELVQIIGNEFD